MTIFESLSELAVLLADVYTQVPEHIEYVICYDNLSAVQCGGVETIHQQPFYEGLSKGIKKDLRLHVMVVHYYYYYKDTTPAS